MRISAHFLVVFILTNAIAPALAPAQKQLALSPRMLSAKSVYFDDRTGVAAVGDKKALGQLKKWGRFQIVQDRKQAQLIILLSASPYKGGVHHHVRRPDWHHRRERK